jgi:tape measure domain-containing protein
LTDLRLKITGDTKDARDEVRRFKQFLHEEFAEVTKDSARTFGGMETDARKSFSSVEASARQDFTRVEQRSRQSATIITRNLHAVGGNFHKSFVTQFDDAFKRGETRAHQFEQRLKSNFKSIIAAIPGSSIAASGAGFLSSLTGGGGGGGALGVLGGVLGGNLLTGALSKLGSGLKGEVTTAFDFLDLQERSKIAFTTIFKNAGLSAEDAAQKAKSHLKDLIDFGAKTPFRAEQLIGLSQQLQAVGFKAEEIIPTLTSIGDAVAGLGGDPQKLDRIILQLGQIKTKGKVSGEELTTLAESSIPAWKYLAEYAGKTVADVQKLAQQNKLDADVAVKVIVAGMGRDFKGLMKDTEGTYSSMWSTIEDLNQQRASEAFEPAFEQVKRGMAGAIGGLSSSAAKNFTTGAAGMQKAVLGSFDGILSSLATGDFQGLGFGAIEGVTKGAKDAAGGLYKEGADAGAQLEQGWRDKMEQHSPSQVMTRLGYAAGLSLVTGFVQGARAEKVAAGLEDFLNDPRVKAFLEVIRKSEGADYHTLVGGSRIKDLSKHPNIVGLVTKAGPSTAFGAYQITGTTNKSKLAALHGLDYSPHNQDLRAVELLRRSGALTELLTDNFVGALKKAGAEWASLPGSTLPGRKRPMDFVTKIYTGANETPRTSSGAGEMSRMSTSQQWNTLLQIPEFRKWFQSTYGAGRTDMPGLNDLPSSAGEFLPGVRSGKQAPTLTPAMLAQIKNLITGTDGAAALPIDSGINLAGLLAAVPDIKLDGLKASINDTKRTQYEFLKSLADIAPTTEEATGKAGDAVEKLGALIKKTQDDHGYFSGANRYARPKPKTRGEDGEDDGGDVEKKATAAQQATASLHATIKDVVVAQMGERL